MQGRQWDDEVWKHVGKAFERLRGKPTAGMTDEDAKTYNTTTLAQLRDSGESRHRYLNLALLSPTVCSIPHDVISMAKAERSARYYFWNQENNLPEAPKVWPQGKNIPVSVLQLNLVDSRRHYGQDSLICGFWLAYA
jgi:hypothetical protein